MKLNDEMLTEASKTSFTAMWWFSEDGSKSKCFIGKTTDDTCLIFITNRNWRGELTGDKNYELTTIGLDGVE